MSVHAAIKARDRLLPGIEDPGFAQKCPTRPRNTRVNNDIIVNFENKNEHADFITFNGLTPYRARPSLSPPNNF
jgi:hypothetical protein